MKENRKDIVLEQKLPWIIFGNGYMAQVTSIMESKDCIDRVVYRMVVRPMEELIKRYDISFEDLDENNQLIVEYPIDSVFLLGSDPAWTVYLCILDFEGKECDSTRKLNGVKAMGAIEPLRDAIRMLKAENAFLKEKITYAETNLPQYVKECLNSVSSRLGSSVGSSSNSNPIEGGITQ